MAKNDEERQPKTEMTGSVAKPARKTSDPTVQAAIGRKLRALYDEVANEPVRPVQRAVEEAGRAGKSKTDDESRMCSATS